MPVCFSVFMNNTSQPAQIYKHLPRFFLLSRGALVLRPGRNVPLSSFASPSSSLSLHHHCLEKRWLSWSFPSLRLLFLTHTCQCHLMKYKYKHIALLLINLQKFLHGLQFSLIVLGHSVPASFHPLHWPAASHLLPSLSPSSMSALSSF